MKKLATLFLAAGMVFAASAPASAVDVKVDGQYTFTYQTGEAGFNNDVNNNYSGAEQRLRLNLSFIASENLSGYVQFQNDHTWGNAEDKHGDNKTLKVRQSYIDWVIPGTPVKVRMGRQQLGFAGEALNPGKNVIMCGGWGSKDAIVLSAPLADNVTASAFWIRTDGASKNGDIDTTPTSDAFGATATLKFPGFVVTPYAMYATIDAGAQTSKNNDGEADTDSAFTWAGDADAYQDTYDAEAYWVGFSATMNLFDPFTLALSAAYGSKDYEADVEKRDGWYVQAKASYKTAFGAPFVGGWYATGDDKDDYKGQGWVPVMGGRFNPVKSYYNGSAGLIQSPTTRQSICGTWGAQVGIEKVSFLKNLSHDFTITYIGGTNHADAVKADNGATKANLYMSENDAVVEFDLTSTYNIYKNLSAILELSYMVSDFEEKDHGNKNLGDNDWRAALHFVYKF